MALFKTVATSIDTPERARHTITLDKEQEHSREA